MSSGSGSRRASRRFLHGARWIRSSRSAAGWIEIPPLGDPFSRGALDQDPAAGWITRKPPLKPFSAIQRILALEGVTPDPAGVTFSPALRADLYERAFVPWKGLRWREALEYPSQERARVRRLHHDVLAWHKGRLEKRRDDPRTTPWDREVCEREIALALLQLDAAGKEIADSELDGSVKTLARMLDEKQRGQRVRERFAETAPMLEKLDWRTRRDLATHGLSAHTRPTTRDLLRSTPALRAMAAAPLALLALLGWSYRTACPEGRSMCGELCYDLARDQANCGSCGKTCAPEEECADGKCQPPKSHPPECSSPFIMCDGKCVDPREDPAHCGACDHRCVEGAMCSGGECRCPAGQTDCGGTCADLERDERHCGKCGHACIAPEGCVDGVCTTCAGKDLTSDPYNCGQCGKSCMDDDKLTGTCRNRSCASCPPGRMNCDHIINRGGVACEVDIRNDASNCGRCGKKCDPSSDESHSHAVCTNQVCGSACNDGWADCNILLFDGCETNLQSDIHHCGDCGHICSAPPNATPLCQNGQCGSACTPPWSDCGSGKCSFDLSQDVEHCGNCIVQCLPPTSGQGVARCNDGKCDLACHQGLTSCAGACVDMQSDVHNCGTCGNVCPAKRGQTRICTGGTCAFVCAPPLVACGKACVDMQSDPKNCGRCGNNCQTGPEQTATTCVRGQCDTGCPLPLTQCGSACVDTLSDPNNCGKCGYVCPSDGKHNGKCAKGTCY